jgi:hypothetical protein
MGWWLLDALSEGEFGDSLAKTEISLVMDKDIGEGAQTESSQPALNESK